VTQLLPYHHLLLLRVSNQAILRCRYRLLVSEKFIIFIYETSILYEKKIIYELYIKYKIHACYVKYKTIKKHSYQLHKKFLIKFISRNQSCFHVFCIFVNRFCYLFRGDIIQSTHKFLLISLPTRRESPNYFDYFIILSNVWLFL